MGENFKKVSKMRLSDQIIMQIKEMIYNEQLTAGDQLPPERELAAQMSVSRLPLREALKALEATHVIRSESGEGYYICGLETDSFVQLLNSAKDANQSVLMDLKEARKIVETSIVNLSCIHRTEEDIFLMQNSIYELARSLQQSDEETDKQAVISNSLDFHRYMMGAAHNQVLSTMMDCITATLHAGRERTAVSRYKKSVQEHQDILDAIIAQDAALAQRLLYQHLDTSYDL